MHGHGLQFFVASLLKLLLLVVGHQVSENAGFDLRLEATEFLECLLHLEDLARHGIKGLNWQVLVIFLLKLLENLLDNGFLEMGVHLA